MLEVGPDEGLRLGKVTLTVSPFIFASFNWAKLGVDVHDEVQELKRKRKTFV